MQFPGFILLTNENKFYQVPQKELMAYGIKYCGA
jgi:hypothetical protein